MEISLISDANVETKPFSRLPRTLPDAIAERDSGKAKEQSFIALELAELSEEEYDQFIRNFRGSTEWLEGTGGWQNVLTDAQYESEEWYESAYHLCIKVVAPNRPTLYVDAQGQDRPIYVAVEGNLAN